MTEITKTMNITSKTETEIIRAWPKKIEPRQKCPTMVMKETRAPATTDLVGTDTIGDRDRGRDLGPDQGQTPTLTPILVLVPGQDPDPTRILEEEAKRPTIKRSFMWEEYIPIPEKRNLEKCSTSRIR